MTDVSVREYHKSDEARVRKLSERLMEGVAPWRDPAKVWATIGTWIDTAISKAATTDDHILLVSENEAGLVTGFLAMNVQQHYIDGQDAYLGELAVDAAYQGQGVGRALIAAGEEWARGKGCERITLQTGAANARARKFYADLGFVEEDVSLARPIT